MIEEVGDYILTKHSREEIRSICETAIFESIVSFGNFIELLGFDSSIFSHLLDVKVIIDYTDEYECNEAFASYISCEDEENNSIHISADFLDKILSYLDKHDISEYGGCINEIACTIVHEAIHANRDIMVNGGKNTLNLLKTLKSRLLVKNNSKLKQELSEILSNKEIFKNATLLKLIDNDPYYIAYVYNDINKSFEKYLLNKNRFDNDNNKIMFNQIESFINFNIIYGKMKPIERISTFIDDEFIGCFSDFAYKHDFDIDELNKAELANLSCIVSEQIGLEESLTEAFANIIIYHKNKTSLEIKEFCFEKLRNDKLLPDIKAAYCLIANMDLDDIKWFFLSSYDDIYTNRFKEIFGSDYNDFIQNMYELYYIGVNNKESDEELYKQTTDMIYRVLK